MIARYTDPKETAGGQKFEQKFDRTVTGGLTRSK